MLDGIGQGLEMLVPDLLVPFAVGRGSGVSIFDARGRRFRLNIQLAVYLDCDPRRGQGHFGEMREHGHSATSGIVLAFE